MFTWISKAKISKAVASKTYGLVMILGLAACEMTSGAFGPSGQPRAIAVLGNALTVAAPAGYCVDTRLVRQQSDGAVVLIGRCNGKSQQAPAVIGVTVGVAGSASVLVDGGTALAAFFNTPSGRAALSRTGNANSVQILKAANVNGAYTMRIAETGLDDYWRAVLGISGRLVTLSVQGPDGSVLPPATGQNLLNATIAAMRSANPPR